MANTWPVFHHELLAQTPYRSVASLPLLTPRRQQFGALDLYSTDPHGHAFQFLAEMGGAVVGPISVVLFDTPATSSEDSVPVPAWMATNPALRRHKRG